MNKFAIPLHINLDAAGGIEYTETLLELGASGSGILGAKWDDVSSAYTLSKVSVNAPIKLDATTNNIDFDISSLTAATLDSADLLIVSTIAGNRKISVDDLKAAVNTDYLVSVDLQATPGLIGAGDSEGVIRMPTYMHKTDGGDYITLGIDDATTTTKGISQYDANQFTVVDGNVQVKTASTTVKGIASYDSDDFSVTDGVVSIKAGAVLNWRTAPTSPSETGTAGSIAYDDDYVYIWVAANKPKRTSLANWS